MFRSTFLLLITLANVSSAQLLVGLSADNPQALSYKDGQFVGTAGAMFQCIWDATGMDYSIAPLPHARLIILLEKQEIDVAMPLAQEPTRDAAALFPEPISTIPFYMFSRNPVEDVGTLTDMTFATLNDSSTSGLISQRNGELVEVISYQSALKMVIAQRVDATVIPGPGLPAFEALTKGLQRTLFHEVHAGLYVNPQRLDVYQALNDAILSCK